MVRHNNKNKKIYILLTNTGTLFSKTIKLYTKAPYTHTSISMDIYLKDLYSFGRKKPRNPFIGGFIKEDINSGVYSMFADINCAVYSLEVDEFTYCEIENRISEFKKEKEKYGYNLFGLLGIIIHRPIEINNNYFCSQFVATILFTCGIDLFSKNPALVCPEDFAYSDKLELVYQGKLSEYSQNVNNKLLYLKNITYKEKALSK